MQQTINRDMIQRIPQQNSEIHPVVKELAKSNFAFAVQSSLAAVVFVPALEVTLGNPIQSSLPWISLVVALSFGAVLICNWLHLGARNLHGVAAIVEARAEIILKRDLNGSGAIGDVIDMLPAPAEDATNAMRDAFSAHVAEFLKVAKVRGISRNAWIEHRGLNGAIIPATQWSDGTLCTKGEHVAICDHLIRVGRLKDRRKGKEGVLTYSDEELALT